MNRHFALKVALCITLLLSSLAAASAQNFGCKNFQFDLPNSFLSNASVADYVNGDFDQDGDLDLAFIGNQLGISSLVFASHLADKSSAARNTKVAFTAGPIGAAFEKRSDPEDIFRKFLTRYRAMNSYQSTARCSGDDGATDWKIYFQHDDQLRLEWKNSLREGVRTTGKLIVSGKNVQLWESKHGTVTTFPDLERAMGQLIYKADDVCTVINLLIRDEIVDGNFEDAQDFRLESAEKIAGVDCYVLLFNTSDDPSNNWSYKLWIGKKDFLIRRIASKLDSESGSEPINESDHYQNIKINSPIPAKLFTKLR